MVFIQSVAPKRWIVTCLRSALVVVLFLSSQAAGMTSQQSGSAYGDIEQPLIRFAQAGSTGGMIGKQGKSASGEDASPRPDSGQRRQQAPARPRAVTTPARGPQTFQNPMSNGMRTDLCQTAAPSGCGEPAATMWCQRKGFKRAASFKWGFGAPAWRQGEGSRCNGPCGVLTEVTCE
jgi:hypothetical protein